MKAKEIIEKDLTNQFIGQRCVLRVGDIGELGFQERDAYFGTITKIENKTFYDWDGDINLVAVSMVDWIGISRWQKYTTFKRLAEIGINGKCEQFVGPLIHRELTEYGVLEILPCSEEAIANIEAEADRQGKKRGDYFEKKYGKTPF